MANIIKAAIPLLDKDFKRSDLSKECGFVNAYFEDINRPQLDSHVFLMYEYFDGSQMHAERDIRFRNMKTLHSTKVIYVNKIPYMLYTFCAFTEDMARLKSGYMPLRSEDTMRVFTFWECKDSFANSLLFDKTPKLEPLTERVPEEDYHPRRFENTFQKSVLNAT